MQENGQKAEAEEKASQRRRQSDKSSSNHKAPGV